MPSLSLKEMLRRAAEEAAVELMLKLKRSLNAERAYATDFCTPCSRCRRS
jgi:hypothetical protein